MSCGTVRPALLSRGVHGLCEIYKESGSGHVSEVVDGNGSLVEVKIAVEQARRKVQLTLYNTKNKVMLQGSKTAVDW